MILHVTPDEDDYARMHEALKILITAVDETVEDLIGAGGKGICYQSSKRYGERYSRLITKENILEQIKELLDIIGLKDYQIESDEGSITLKINSCPLGNALKERGVEKGGAPCFLVNGIIAGTLSHLTNEKRDVKIVETNEKCVKKVE